MYWVAIGFAGSLEYGSSIFRVAIVGLSSLQLHKPIYL